MQRLALVPTCLVILGALATPAAAQKAVGGEDWSRRGHVSQGLPEFDVSDPEAPQVTAEDVLERERFWPYRVELVRDWTGEAGQTLSVGTPGVLVRMESSGKARIDFGRDGLHEVPLEATDVVALADAVRRGEERKIAPNLVHVIGPRLADSSGQTPGPYRLAKVADNAAFLSVYADPTAEGFQGLARALGPLQERQGVLTVLFPQGRHADPDVRERLRALDWKVPFVLDHFSEAYTRSQLEEPRDLPVVQLQTPEGRVLLRSGFHGGLQGEIAAALDRAFGGEKAPSSLGREGAE